MSKSSYTPEFRAKIAQEYLNGNCSRKDLSKKYNTEPAGQVKWLFSCPAGSPNLTLRSVYCNRSGLFSLNLFG